MTQSKLFTYNGSPLDGSEEHVSSPDEARARIAAGLKEQQPVVDVDTIDYSKAYQMEVENAATKENRASEFENRSQVTDSYEEMGEVKTAVSTSPTYQPMTTPQSPSTTFSGDLLTAAHLNQEKLLKSMARISEERSHIRQKILDNNIIIEQARRAEIENQALESEYLNQETILQKLQQFNTLFEECRDYLN